jgi:Leucine-rich repeat (LRR) protein
MNFPKLQILECSNNELIELPPNIIFPNLDTLQCGFNKLTRLPVCILNLRNLTSFNYDNNEIELSPEIAQFINLIKTNSIAKKPVYNGGPVRE